MVNSEMCTGPLKHVRLRLSLQTFILGPVVVLLLGRHVLAACPSMCSCTHNHREVDCSWRGLRLLPDGLQHNVRSLNLSHNRFHNLDDQLTMYTHLRVLDLSHNRLHHLPTGLPRSLWQLYAASNRLQVLDKNDTVYQWNLRTLDLSNNKLERAIFINNTLTNLCTLNMSHNNFWTLPTNLPVNLEVVDLSHNLLVKVLPGSLDRLPKLTHMYLHANRFSMLPFGVLDKLTSLKVITLGNNPWGCRSYSDINYLLSWTQHTPAKVLGCPCHTQSVCGEGHPSRTGGWHHVAYDLHSLASNAQDLRTVTPRTSVPPRWPDHGRLITSVTLGQGYPFKGHHPASAHPDTFIHMFHTTSPPVPGTNIHSPPDSFHVTGTSSFSIRTETAAEADVSVSTEKFSTTNSGFGQTKKTTTLRTRSVRRQNQSYPKGISNSGSLPLTFCPSLPTLDNVRFLLLILQLII
ncbi:oligodendrocyte-myelin glycoprotein isoform X2 [Cynoglossus semilaevis]|uniref:oligodendrocyte-myelin glycoprotein isoform X2 n=1 Tax=Cynoglossus semilaevis TaxID=244447 RepID=UPI0007DCAD34|nr:oligodendrocyte-myelin glycoprotein isoform X2 [Cynoglossus semilaevis]